MERLTNKQYIKTYEEFLKDKRNIKAAQLTSEDLIECTEKDFITTINNAISKALQIEQRKKDILIINKLCKLSAKKRYRIYKWLSKVS